MKKQFIEFFRPDRNKVVVTLFYPYIVASPFFILLIYLAVFSGEGVALLKGFLGTEMLVLGLLFSVFSYPFVCVLFWIYRSRRARDMKKTFSSRTVLALLFISIIISNPISAYFLAHISGLAVNILFYKTLPVEGVQVIGISPDSPAAYGGVFFGERIYTMEIYRDEERVLTKRTKDSQEFYDAMEEVRVGDVVRFISVAGFPTQFTVEKNFTDMRITVQSIGTAPLPLVEVVEISNTRFEGMVGKKIYEIEVYEEEVTIIKESYGTRSERRRLDLRRYRINGSEDFYRVLNSVKVGETIIFKTTSVNHPGFLIEKNVTDWGIKVRDIELK